MNLPSPRLWLQRALYQGYSPLPQPSPTLTQGLEYSSKVLRSKSVRVLVSLAGLGLLLLVSIGAYFLRRVHGSQQHHQPWPFLKFPREDEFYQGMWRRLLAQDPNEILDGEISHEVPQLLKYWPYHGDQLGDRGDVEQCFLDNNTLTPPSIWAYESLSQSESRPLLGSYNVLGLRDDVCFDRYGRYGPYGLGYNSSEGGTSLGMHGDQFGTEHLWSQEPQRDWRQIDLGIAQKRCYEKNAHRFESRNRTGDRAYNPHEDHFSHHETRLVPSTSGSTPGKHLPRTVIVLRAWGELDYTDYRKLNLRALINELNLNSGAEYDVHLLVHIKDNTKPIWASREAYDEVLNATVPPEFRSMATLWSRQLMELIYPGPFDPQPAYHGPLHGALRGLHLALQWFATLHPEYDFFWHWEMDIRYLGHYYELLDRVSQWAKQQPRDGMWERSGRFYIPDAHGDWSSFSNETQALNSGSEDQPTSVAPAIQEENTRRTRRSNRSSDNTGSSTTSLPSEAPEHSGIGEDADFISLNPLFDPKGTLWIYRNDVSGYTASDPAPARRASIVTASRLSRRLLQRMHEECYSLRHSMGSETFPATMAMKYGYKAVFAPHPVYFDRKWPPEYADSVFNGGPNGSSGGWNESIFGEVPQRTFQGSTYYYNSGFAGALWRRWLGYKENGDGGAKAELDPDTGGRMCLKSVLVHPIKYELGPIE